MAEIVCPYCGAKVDKPIKTWFMAGRPSKTGEKLRLTIAYAHCPKCGRKFRKVIEKKKIA